VKGFQNGESFHHRMIFGCCHLAGSLSHATRGLTHRPRFPLPPSEAVLAAGGAGKHCRHCQDSQKVTVSHPSIDERLGDGRNLDGFPSALSSGRNGRKCFAQKTSVSGAWA
jgi:hypothetical protein